MTSETRLLPVLSALAGVLLIAGCASSTPGSTAPSSSPAPSSSASEDADDSDIEGVVLDGGRMFAVVTRGSSSLACAPQIRLAVRRMVSPAIERLPVLSYTELTGSANVRSAGVISSEQTREMAAP